LLHAINMTSRTAPNSIQTPARTRPLTSCRRSGTTFTSKLTAEFFSMSTGGNIAATWRPAAVISRCAAANVVWGRSRPTTIQKCE